MNSHNRNRTFAQLCLVVLLFCGLVSCKKSAVMTLQLFTPTGIDTLDGVTELRIFVDQSTDGLMIPLSTIGQPDAFVDVDADKQNHVLTIEAYKEETLVSRGRSLSLLFEAKNVATRVVLWPVERFAPLRATLADDWQGTAFFQLADHRIVALHDSRTSLFEFSTATFVDGPELPGALVTPVGLPLDANRLILIGQTNSYTLDLTAESATATVWDGETPSSQGGRLIKGADTTYVLVNPAPAASYIIDTSTLKVTRLEIPEETSANSCVAVEGGYLWLVGGNPTGDAIRLVELATKTRTSVTDASVTIPPSLTDCGIAVLESGELLVFGGKSDTVQSAIYRLKPTCLDGSCALQIAAGALQTARYRFGLSVMRDGSVLVSGGLGDADQPQSNAEIVAIENDVITLKSTVEMIRSRVQHRSFRLDAGEILLLGGEARIDGELYMPR
ncbi:MAG: hypothetical protein KC609_02350 [Myxococcales bacterium]|nr:hypothetical protein [Myxococcales bacterium]